MTQQTRQPVFPLVKTWTILTALSAGLFAILWWAAPAMFGRPDGAAKAVVIMAAIVWLSGLVSVLPVALIGPIGAMATVQAFFLGAAARVMACLAAMAVCIKLLALPAGVVVVTLMAMYLPVLFTETAMVVRFVRTAAFLGGGRAEGKGGRAEGRGPRVEGAERGAEGQGPGAQGKAGGDGAARYTEVFA